MVGENVSVYNRRLASSQTLSGIVHLQVRILATRGESGEEGFKSWSG